MTNLFSCIALLFLGVLLYNAGYENGYDLGYEAGRQSVLWGFDEACDRPIPMEHTHG